MQFAFGLLKLFPTLSPAWDGPESSRILHHDLHTSNIIIGQDGQDKKENETKIVGLLDWEIRQCRSRMGIHVNYRGPTRWGSRPGRGSGKEDLPALGFGRCRG